MLSLPLAVLFPSLGGAEEELGVWFGPLVEGGQSEPDEPAASRKDAGFANTETWVRIPA